MLSRPVPDLAWQYNSQDILKHNSRYYFVTVDHYSDFFEFEATKWVSSDKSHRQWPHFISEAYTQFAKLWNFQHVTSSPYFSQSNGRAEVAVKSTKHLLKTCSDPLLGLLHLRNTPTKGNTYSPVQRLMGRRTRTLMPITSVLLYPITVSPARSES